MAINQIMNGIEILAALAGSPDTTALEQKAMDIDTTNKIEVVADTINKKIDSNKTIDFTDANFEFHATGDLETSKTRLNLFYTLPGNTKVYSFIEFYPKDGFFSKTMASTSINKHGTNAYVETKNSNLFNDKIAVGMSQSFGIGPVYGSVKAMPAWFDKTGYVANSTTVGGFAGVGFNIPIGKTDFKVDITAFADINVAKKGGPQWDYGEIEAKVAIPTKIGKFNLGAGYNFNSTGKFKPDAQFRVNIGYSPRK